MSQSELSFLDKCQANYELLLDNARTESDKEVAEFYLSNFASSNDEVRVRVQHIEKYCENIVKWARRRKEVADIIACSN